MFFRIFMPFRALGAIFRSFWAWVFRYRTLTTPKEQARRLKKCHGCDFLLDNDQCKLCGCFVQAKTMLCVEKCPAGKWKAIWKKKK